MTPSRYNINDLFCKQEDIGQVSLLAIYDSCPWRIWKPSRIYAEGLPSH